MTDITTVASPATAQPAVPPILFTKDLPGPLSLNRLAAFGTLHKLDDSAGYWIEHSGTLYGRAKIVAEVAPFGTVVCSMTAAWVWLGGPDFPSTIDVISTSHFRSASVSSWGSAIRHSRATRESFRFSAASAAFHSASRSGVGTPSGATMSADNTPPFRVKS